MRLIVAATLSLALATPVLAVDAITYKGTLGKLPIIAELATSSDGVLVGRYSYLNKGGDIPLDAGGETGGPIMLAEEAPCTETTCIQNDNGDVPDKPVGAYWTLVQAEDDATITGSWAAVDKSGKTLDIKLERIGQRALADDVEVSPFGLYDSAFQTTYAGLSAFTPETAPYDFAKMDVPLEIGATQTIEGSSFHYVADPRSKFLFPRIVALADGSAPDLANKALARRHALINFHAFDCMAMIYAGFGANQYSAGGGAGTLGDYDGENVEVSYLSPTVMSWSESGSTWCGGAHPNNHSDSYNLDVRAGATLAMAKVFKDWTAQSRMRDYDNPNPIDQVAAGDAPDQYFWGAGQPLVDFAIDHRVHESDAQFETDCGIDDLIASNLNFRFVPGESVVFSLEGLPNVVAACGGDLLTVQLKTIPELLAPTAVDYFPGLAN